MLRPFPTPQDQPEERSSIQCRTSRFAPRCSCTCPRRGAAEPKWDSPNHCSMAFLENVLGSCTGERLQGLKPPVFAMWTAQFRTRRRSLKMLTRTEMLSYSILDWIKRWSGLNTPWDGTRKTLLETIHGSGTWPHRNTMFIYKHNFSGCFLLPCTNRRKVNHPNCSWLCQSAACGMSEQDVECRSRTERIESMAPQSVLAPKA